MPAASQLQPVLLRLATAGGAQAVTVSLHPGELGRVEVRLERDDGGSTQVALTAERPETLRALIRDQAQLSSALDRAGVPEDGRSLTFHLAQAETSAALISSAPPIAPSPGGSPLTHGGAALSSGSPGEGQGGQGEGAQEEARGRSNGPAAPSSLPDPGEGPEESRSARWLRLGIDITA